MSHMYESYEYVTSHVSCDDRRRRMRRKSDQYCLNYGTQVSFSQKKKTHQKVLFVDIWTYTKTTTEIRHNNVTSITIITEYASLFPEKKPHVLHEWVMSHVNITSITVLPHLQNTRLYTENTRV